MSFDSVSGRLVREAVQEGDEVRAGDVIMELDATDNELAMARVNAQIAQIEAQIAGGRTSMGISLAEVGTNETQTFRQIDVQRARAYARGGGRSRRGDGRSRSRGGESPHRHGLARLRHTRAHRIRQRVHPCHASRALPCTAGEVTLTHCLPPLKFAPKKKQ